ncbi:Retrovirus-related Pol polyprotein from transposon TNT 1-94 [Vitis vinifera]|uniref:Retrovirus-related Pol polyprotein from transposon TNT 1-94 n=1 Tax=Vitis vinifera TaxID=29760 RepID=A0A438JX64_VITVI|nr:Retrovirus-related Pol polyprotein from transposon TNT 1-94 [Vitis vinifera]
MIAMKEKLSMIEKNKTWILIERLRDRRMIRVKRVYSTKLNVDGSINKNKARLVVKGYNQVFGMDYSDTFALVTRLDTIRLLLAVAAQNDWRVYQLDVKSAFLNGFAKSLSESTLYVKHNGAGILIISLYVDDLLVIGNHTSLVEKFKLEIMEVFEMMNLVTRPDILNVVSILSQFIHCASEMHLKTAKRVIRYVKGTCDFGIKFMRSKEFELVGF